MTYVRNLDNDNLRQLATKALDDYVPVDDRLSAVMMLQDDMPRSILRLLDEIANRDDLLKRCQNHLFAGERRAWCWCADNQPGRDPGDHDPDCKWVAQVEKVGGLRREIDKVLGRQ